MIAPDPEILKVPPQLGAEHSVLHPDRPMANGPQPFGQHLQAASESILGRFPLDHPIPFAGDRPEVGEPQKRKRPQFSLAFSPALGPLKAQQPGLFRVKTQSVLGEPLRQDRHEPIGVVLALKRQDGVVSKAHQEGSPLEAGLHRFLEPAVQDLMEVDVTEQRGDHPALRNARLGFCQASILHDPGVQPLPYKPPQHTIAHPMTKDLLELASINGVEVALDIQVHGPIIAPAALPDLVQRLVSRFPGPVAVGVSMKHLVQLRLQQHLHHRLPDPISHRRNAKGPGAASLFRNAHPPHRWRHVRARGHAIPELVQIVLQIALKVRKAFSIHPGRALIGLDPMVGFPDQLLGDVKWLRLMHGILPQAVVTNHKTG